LAEPKSRKAPRKIKSEKAFSSKTGRVQPDDQDIEMEELAAKRHTVRKPTGSKASAERKLSPSSGMGDIVAPANGPVEVEEEDIILARKRSQVVQDMPADDLGSETDGFFSETPAIEYAHVEHTHMASGFHSNSIHGSLNTQAATERDSETVDREVIAQEEDNENDLAPEIPAVFSRPSKATAKQMPTAQEMQTKTDEGNLLAPDYKSFNLESKKARSGIATFFIWLLDILIVLGIVALILLYKFPNQSEAWIAKIMPRFASQQQSTQTNSPATTGSNQSSNAQPVFRTASSVGALAQAVDAAVSSGVNTVSLNKSADTSEIASLNLGNDTILYKSASQAAAQTISTLVTQQFGIQAQMQEDDTLTEDIVLFLTPTVQNPNLSNDVAIVYNGNGISGIAKQYCGYLTADKVSSCASANAPAPTTGLVVSYKNQVAYATLIRTSQFANATFQQAPSTQTQDIVVTVGK
jgi:hypothetical protein